mgnify:CR=1 FL=1
MQDLFLNHVRRNKTPVTMFLGSYCLSSVQALRMKEAAAAGKPKSE